MRFVRLSRLALENERLGLIAREKIGRDGWCFGINVRAVSFADHRSGWSAIRVSFHFASFSLTVYPIIWETSLRAPERVVSLREQLQLTHGKGDEDG